MKRKFDNSDDEENEQQNKKRINDSDDNDSSESSCSDNDEDIKRLSNRSIAIRFLRSIARRNKKNKTKDVLKKMEKKINKLEKKIDQGKNIIMRNNKISLEIIREIYNDMNIEYERDKKTFKIIKYLETLDNNETENSNQIVSPPNFMLLINSLMPMNERRKKSNNEDNLNETFKELNNFDSTVLNSYEFFNKMETEQKIEIIDKLKKIKEKVGDEIPNIIKVLEWNTKDENKITVLSKIQQFENSQGMSEYFKLKSWINKIMRVPMGNYIKPLINQESNFFEVSEYLDNIKNKLNESIYGHEDTKTQLIKLIAQTISNPKEGGNIFALEGPPGVGKTALINDGISKALNRPYSFISLGGATDSSYLEGFEYTYEGSTYGKIVDILIQTKCMNPIIYFDELDKVSNTAKGEEIINILMHLTDVTQNDHFNDKYFSGIDFDLSKAIMIFSFNDGSKISRILRDRMKIIKVNGYKLQDKIEIARDFMIPKLLESNGLKDYEIDISDNVVKFIIENYTNEGGVRRLKEILSDILMEINLRKLQGNFYNIELTENDVENDYLKKKHKFEPIMIYERSRIGLVNGLWANSLGVGGLIPIECSWIPSNKKLNLELTGMQGKVMKESMMVARTIAWKILPKKMRNKITMNWKDSSEYGIHIHCPDGSTPKDGPSAGGAITTCLISLLTGIPVNNEIAMTGEINLKGQITKIGGLEEKLFGAKRAGAKLVLYPFENKKDVEEIQKKYKDLIDDEFRVEMVNDIWEILSKVLIKECNFIRLN